MINKEIWMQIRNLFKEGLTITAISNHLDLDRKTVSKYIKNDKSPKYNKTKLKKSKLDDFKEYIIKRLEEYNLTSNKIYNEIQAKGYFGKYGIVAIFVREIKKTTKTKAVLRFETLPGQQAQVDWGFFGKIYDNEQQKTINLCCFFMILGFSRTLYIEFFDSADTLNFLIGHKNAFNYFNGYTKEILYDNLKSVVIKRKLKASESEFNQKFMDFAGYYGFKPILARPYKPNTKGKVEKSVDFVRNSFFAGEKFASLRDINDKAIKWLNIINNRTHMTTKQIPFDRLKFESLISLPSKEYDTNFIYFRKVSIDCFLSFNGNFYSVPFEFAGKEVSIKFYQINNKIDIYYQNKIIGCHILELIKKGQYISNPNHFTNLDSIRKSHTLNRPKKPANLKDNLNNLFLLQSNLTTTDNFQRNLSIYDEVAL